MGVKYKISGHETFALRYAWLPKCMEAVQNDPYMLSDESKAMVFLGVGKNMVRSIRFWGLTTGIITSENKSGYKITELGSLLFDKDQGLDPYLEDNQTLWLLHWKLCTAKVPLFAWYFLLNRWHEPELVLSSILPAANHELEMAEMSVSDSSLKSHFSVFFHTYIPTKGKKSKNTEDTLDCPLVELELLEYRSERKSIQGKTESVLSFRRGKKPEINNHLFVYTLLEFWKNVAINEKTLSFREIAFLPYSPGQIFKLNERDIRERLEQIEKISNGKLVFSGSSLIQVVHRYCEFNQRTFNNALKGVYR